MKDQVRARYAAAAISGRMADCGPVGYPEADLAGLPAGAVNLSLGCGNPLAVADLPPGETVLDLGSGGGIHVLLSAPRAGPTRRGSRLGMAPGMLAGARKNAEGGGNGEVRPWGVEATPLPGS